MLQLKIQAWIKMAYTLPRKTKRGEHYVCIFIYIYVYVYLYKTKSATAVCRTHWYFACWSSLVDEDEVVAGFGGGNKRKYKLIKYALCSMENAE